MDKFDIESLQENIHFKETKLYFQEVMMTYQIRAYRSAVVTLWSVAVCDIVLRLQHLIDLYNDPNAVKIVQKIKGEQNKDSKSSAWELQILEEVLKQTQLINHADFENLKYLQKQRHLCAHPILSDGLQLYKPNKETTRALIRNTLESVLSKPPFYTDKIIPTILEDLSEAQNILVKKSNVKRYIEDRYLNRLPLEVELKLYRTLWKLTFRLDNVDCKKNRMVNLQILFILTERHPSKIYQHISEDKNYYTNISNSKNIISFLVFYLSETNRNFFLLLSESAQTIIKETCQKNDFSMLHGWFIYENLADYCKIVFVYMNKNSSFIISKIYWENIFNFSDSIEWDNQVNQLMVFYYCSSPSNNIALKRYNSTILPFLDKFNNQEKIEFLLKNIELSYKLCNKETLKSSHQALRKHFEKILPKEFDFTVYPQFNAQTLQETSPDISQLNKLD
ncbi:hypothetical protein [Commensalibacter communis]|uniref:hypothetical protein n=1 Tax=Commensalibacter communis TaxID=2972786 RepID=UPI0022FF5E18|nr:hypothetical protein [Commensalibacter communis]CAI3937002.1 unnamed protein product [Commensalibacter communis]CAI3941133.1 unnamed protein product [Commensalibacter communis]